MRMSKFPDIQGEKKVNILLMPVVMLAAGAAGAWIWRKYPLAATVIGAGCACGSCAAGLTLLGLNFYYGNPPAVSHIFALPVLVLALSAAIYSVEYLAGHGSERAGSYWTLFDLTAGAMLYVTTAETPLSFLLAWEVMGAASFGLVLFDRHNHSSGRAAWIYMMACHAGAAFLILLFFFPHTPVWMFVLALLGFGLKIGFPLLHVWLPEAHPAAPAPVSALMSGAMIELGFFGILSFGIYSPEYAALYGWVFVLLGLVSAPSGIIFALAQSNLKKLLAYSSIENMGILSCALGIGFLGEAYGIPQMSICGFSGAVLHLLNHALLKGGLFLGAGSVYKACGTLDMDKMGGLLKRMPKSGMFFILHALSLCGLPPFAGFAGEFLIYMAAFAGLGSDSPLITAVSIAVLILLALTGGLAAAAFAKAIGAVFCGEPRSTAAADAGEVPVSMNIPVAGLWIVSWALMFAFPFFLEHAGTQLFPESSELFVMISGTLASVVSISFGVSVLTLVVFGIRQLLIRRSGERYSLTWDCGFAYPCSRMEYTATSFGQNPVDFFRWILRPRRKIEAPQGIFPEKARLEEEIADGGIAGFWQRIFRGISVFADRIHRLQSGNLHFYLLVMVLTIAGMLIWAVWGGF